MISLWDNLYMHVTSRLSSSLASLVAESFSLPLISRSHSSILASALVSALPSALAIRRVHLISFVLLATAPPRAGAVFRRGVRRPLF